MSKIAYRIGAIFYGIWGLLHIPIGYSVYMGGLNLESGIVQGRVFQVGFFLSTAGIASLIIARWNWSNHPAAYWSNLWLTTIVDIGFLLFIQFPGYVSLTRGLPGPITWIIAAIFSTIGYLQISQSSSRRTSVSKVVIADNKPTVMQLEPGTYYWCSCGRSKKQPFCDGTHQGTSFTPQAFDVTEQQRVALCLCKHTNNAPFCDGSHTKLEDIKH